MKILIALSDKKLAQNIKNHFSRNDIVSMIVENGDEVIARMKGFKPDLLLIDYVLPHKSGYDVLNEKSFDKDVTKIPTMIVSNSGDAIHLNKIPNTPTIKDFYISANIDEQILLSKIQHIS